MTEHLLLPGLILEPGYIHPSHAEYLREWREAVIQRADVGDIASSICLQAVLIDLVLDGRPRHDWIGVMDEFLMDGERPLAYSEAFGKRLCKYEGQYLQSSVHAIHTRWWIEHLNARSAIDNGSFARLILAKKQTDGLIYDADISPTMLRHRMKSELTLSMAMATEILALAGQLTDPVKIEIATNLCSPAKCPPLGYMSMEYFRLKALELLDHTGMFPSGIEANIEACAEDLPIGWCDFSVRAKVDAYMGTAKRTQRDHPIHSPLIACYVAQLIEKTVDPTRRGPFEQRFRDYARHLKRNPVDIPAFQMRDIPIPFGADRTPLEVICASYLIANA